MSQYCVNNRLQTFEPHPCSYDHIELLLLVDSSENPSSIQPRKSGPLFEFERRIIVLYAQAIKRSKIFTSTDSVDPWLDSVISRVVQAAEDPKVFHHPLTATHCQWHPVDLSIPEILEDVHTLRFLPKVLGGSYRNFSYIRSLLKGCTLPFSAALDSAHMTSQVGISRKKPCPLRDRH